jgi:hypothetical protein
VPPDFRRQLEGLSHEWFSLEEQLKRYETLVGDALSPAVFSLRYAGRQMALALLAATAEPPSEDQLDSLRDAIRLTKHYLQMSKYDIVDGVLIHIDRDLTRNLLPRYGRDVIEQSVVGLPRMLAEITICRQMVVDSRGNPQTRESLYDQMLDNHLPHVLAAYQEIAEKENDTIMARLVDHQLHLRSEKAAALFGVFAACFFGLLSVFQLDSLRPIWDVSWPLWIPAFIFGFYYLYARVAWPNQAQDIARKWRWPVGVVTFICVAKFGDLAFPGFLDSITALGRRIWSR